MSKKPFNKSGTSEVDTERRKFLKSSGAAIASGLAVPFMASSDSAAAGSEGDENSFAESRVTQKEVSSGVWNKPNIILIITDQERYPMHWPAGWADANLPNRRRLARHGLTFTKGFTAASTCVPSRGTMFTGLYAPEHGATQTVTPNLLPSIPNMATMLAGAGYDVEYRGKWHLSLDPTGTVSPCSGRELELFGFHGWEPPEFGNGIPPSTYGGGTVNYDERCASDTADFLKNRKSSKPFALVVSFANPHDILSYPGNPRGTGWDAPSKSNMPPYEGTANYADVDFNASPLDQIGFPDNFAQEPYKPTCQAEANDWWYYLFGKLENDEEKLNYARFYAYLNMAVDKHMGTVLDALKSRPNMFRNTIIIRIADHGEMGLSHGGMLQKSWSGYEETINIPFVISNPVLFPKPVQTSALASTVDIMPTLATICGVPKRKIPTLRGVDLTPILRNAMNHPDNPTRKVQDSVLFTHDDDFLGLFVHEPSHVRCLREERWKIVLYFDPKGVEASVYELYDLQTDPLEKNNLAHPDNPSYNADMLAQMKVKLEAKMEETKTTPA